MRDAYSSVADLDDDLIDYSDEEEGREMSSSDHAKEKKAFKKESKKSDADVLHALIALQTFEGA
jgi:hypothetical protein